MPEPGYLNHSMYAWWKGLGLDIRLEE
jgi:hypothetical protein